MVLFALAIAACGRWSKVAGQPTQEEVYAAIAASVEGDADHDGLPDDVERRYAKLLGTDPERADSDGDGLNDAFELFGKNWLFVATAGRAGQLTPSAEALPAADATRSHAEDLVDSDGDGVPDYLEWAGYRYDWQRAAFVVDPAGFHTDPLQRSTDQDAYGDGMEVSGLNMDVAVRAPGNHPLVPAYPDIVIELAGYSVVLNDEVTDASGGELERGTTWNREVENTHSSGSEKGYEIETKFSFTGKGVTFDLGGKWSQKWTTTDTHTEKSSSGGSFAERMNWNTARSFSPAEAARLSLLVRVHNRGTAPASNLVPTIGLLIGGANVATFEAGQVPIYMLLPGATYPADDAVNLVVDRDSAGNLLTVTDWELRALQGGAPLSLVVTQKKADVMRLEDGAWVPVGDVNEYLARIVSVSANVFLDFGVLPEGAGQARLARRLVYAGQGPAAPPVTLEEALRFTDGFDGDADSGFTLDYWKDDGTRLAVPLGGTDADDRTWRWLIDPVTLRSRWEVGTEPQSFDEVLALRLKPGSQVSLRAPRPHEAELPLIHTAYAVPTDRGYEIVACASDYDAVARVVFVDKYGNETALGHDGRGPWFFSVALDGYSFRNERDPAKTTPEQVRVESQRTTGEGEEAVPLTASADVEVVYTPAASAPTIRRFTYDSDHGRFYARVEPGGSLPEDEVDWVRLYHPELAAGDAGVAGYASLQPTIYAFEDPYGWEVSGLGYLDEMRLVAHTRGGRYSSRTVENLTEMTAFREGTIWLRATDNDNVLAWWDDEWWTPEADLDAAVPLNDDCGNDPGKWQLYPQGFYLFVENPAWASCVAADPRQETYYVESDGFLDNNPASTIWNWWMTLSERPGEPDLYVRATGPDSPNFVVGFHQAGTAIGDTGGLTGPAYYDALGYADVLELDDVLVPGQHDVLHPSSAESFRSFAVGTVFVFRTSEGRPGKAIVRSTLDLDEYVDTYSFQKNVQLDYRIYKKEGDGHRPDGMSYTTPDALYVVGRELSPPNRPTTTIGDVPDDYWICLGPALTRCLDGHPETTNDDPTILPAGLAFDTHTGALSGTPASGSAQVRTEYRVYGANSAGYTTAPLWIRVIDALTDLSFESPIVCPTGYACRVQPSVVGTAEQYALHPTALPAGLSFAQATGTVSGTPTAITGATTYSVTASNSSGATVQAAFVLSTPLGAPDRLSYGAASFTYAVGATVSLPATVHGGAVSTWSVSAGLPAGLTLNPATGAIEGQPTTATPANSPATCTVTAGNSAGSSRVTLTFTITAS